jgi:hypothetical protein
VFRAFAKGMGSCFIVGSAYHKNTNAKVERANGILSDTLRAVANCRKDDWDGHLHMAVFTVNNAQSTLGGTLTLFFIDRRAHPRLPLSPPRDDSSCRNTSPPRTAHAGNGGDGTRAVDGGKLESGAESSTRAGSTQCSEWGTRAEVLLPRSCLMPRISASSARGGMAPSL